LGEAFGEGYLCVPAETTIVVCDHHELCRRALRLLLDQEPDFRVVGVAGPGTEVAETTRLQRPDVVVVAADPSCGDGETTVWQLKQMSPVAPHVVILTGAEDEELMASTLRAGASAFLLRSDPVAVFTAALRQVAVDSAVLSPRMTRRMLDRASTVPSGPGAPGALAQLTSRELEMLRCLARGLSNREIAGEIGIAIATVKAHVSRLLTKLGLRDRSAAVVFAYEVGLVRPRARPVLNAYGS
jgi:DNA-binding NarL/FixJ family response regulator